MYPAAVESNLALDQPDATAEDVLDALRPLGDSVEIPTLLVDVLYDYLKTYRADNGTPIFSGETYFLPAQPGTELTKEQRALDVVDSYTMSISLTLAALGFLKVFSRSVRRPQLLEKIS